MRALTHIMGHATLLIFQLGVGFLENTDGKIALSWEAMQKGEKDFKVMSEDCRTLDLGEQI